MPWTSAVQTVEMTENAPLPDSERIRREALQRSWQRDKKVSARRLKIRWAVWALCRYGLPLLFVLGTAIAVSIWGLPQLRTALTTLTGPMASPTVNVGPTSGLPAPSPASIGLSIDLPPAGKQERSEMTPAQPGQSDDDQGPIQLRPESSFPSSNHGDHGQTGPDDIDTTTTLNPVRTPDNGSHSKEP
ncbi:hypothetical protein [Hydrogenophaga sp.]|uniref:hypothetical protein n=1 Tax=Hydrogenophaga sp. TaxID=1904254 RepID=UPI002718BDBF|nr:hypothetical protein [Hydrogenophaga sp.]MDO8904581.1 hypothetical protein [Hydrogenophaga sp.]